MNKWIGMGRLVADPEIRYVNGNVACCKFKIAIKRPGKKQEGQPDTDFISITAWGKTGEFAAKWFKKGQQVLVEGYLRNNNWTDKDGNKRYADEVHAEHVYFADSKRDRVDDNKTYSEPVLYQLSESDEDSLPF